MIIFKTRSDSYFRAAAVLAIDLITSLIASICGLLLIRAVSPDDTLPRIFMIKWMAVAAGASVLALYITRSYRLIIRYSTLKEIGKLSLAVIVKEAILGTAFLAFTGHGADPGPQIAGHLLFLDFFVTIGALVMIRVIMLTVYQFINGRINAEQKKNKVLVYGIGGKAASLVTRLQNSKQYKVAGFLTYGKEAQNQILAGFPVHGFTSKSDILYLNRKLDIDGILFAHQHDAKNEKARLIDFCQEAGLKMYIAPSIDEMKDGMLPNSGIRRIKIEDLLGRSEIKVSMEEIRAGIEGKTVLVTGAAGSIGSELCRQLAKLDVRELVLFDNAETPLHNVRLEFEDTYRNLKFTPIIGDVRQPERLDYVFREFRPQIVFHAAAYKHVPLMEYNPCEAVLVNVAGSRNVADKCIEYDVEKMIMISTDKAVNPTNIMGCTKRLAEIYVQSLGLAIENGEIKGRTQFVTTRFGNVLGSNGSVIPRFTEQIERGGPVTVTDPKICRYFMTIPEACRLVMEAATMVTETRIFVFDMGTPVKIADLARKMIQLAGFEVDKDIKIEYTGLRPGEKLYEEVLANKENIIPTDNDRIFVAKVRKYAYEEIRSTVSELERLARKVTIPDMVILMKKTVPEFKSKHSVFEKYDKQD